MFPIYFLLNFSCIQDRLNIRLNKVQLTLLHIYYSLQIKRKNHTFLSKKILIHIFTTQFSIQIKVLEEHLSVTRFDNTS